MKTTNVIEISNLKKAYKDVQAVDDITFKVRKGEIFGLIGPNGAGKSTTIEMIVGLIKKDSGSIKVLNEDIEKGIKSIKNSIGVQLQTSSLLKSLKVKEIISLYSSFYKKPLPVDEVINMVGLESKEDSLISKLSGGQKQDVETVFEKMIVRQPGLEDVFIKLTGRAIR